MIVAGLVLLLQTAATVGRQTKPRAQTVAAPPESVVVRTPAHTTTLRLTNTGGVVGVDAAKLAAALGGTFKLTSPSHYSLTVGDSHISFTDAVPFAGDDSTIVPMTSPPRATGKNVTLPFFVVAELVPRFFSGYMYDPDLHEVRQFDGTARRVQAPAAARPDTPAAGATPREIGEAAAVARVAAETPVRVKRPGRRLIVVDAGHGGVDPGMHGPIGGGPRSSRRTSRSPCRRCSPRRCVRMAPMC